MPEEGEHDGCQEHLGSKGQASQDGEGEKTRLHSNQLGHKKEDGEPNADMGTQRTLVAGYRRWESRVSARERGA